jgi:hypothetical protein
MNRLSVHPAPGPRLAPPLAALAVAAALVAVPQPALATITLNAEAALMSGAFTYIRRLTMRVGVAQFGTVSNVAFNVTGANVSPTPVPVTGVPSAGAGVAGSPTNSVRISVSNRWTAFAGQRVIVTANSAAGLSCTSGPCTGTVIPFSKISWTASSLAGAPYTGQDFVSGGFNDSANQTLIDFTAPASRSVNITNDWVFTYANDTLYPAGVYQGRVTFTATMP